MNRAALLVSLLALSPASSAAADDRRVAIAVMDLVGRGVDDLAAAALTTEVGNTLAAERVFRVITREDVRRMLQLEETRAQCTGEVDASCMAEIGGALGVDYMVHGEVARIGDTFNVTLVLLDTARAEARSRERRRVEGPRRLLEEIEDAARVLVRPLLADRKGFLVLDVRERGAKVTVDGRLVGVTPLPGRLELPMGAHEVLVEKESFLVYGRTLDVQPGQATVEVVALVPSPGYAAAFREDAVRTRALAWTTAGLGAALLGTAAALRLVGDARFDDLVAKRLLTQQASVCEAQDPAFDGRSFCPTTAGHEQGVLDEVASIERGDSIALVSLLTGGVSAVVSALLFATGEDPDRYQLLGDVGVHVGPSGATLRARF
jgi:TolB-like protein